MIDPVASAALDARVIKPVYLAMIDFENEVRRVNTSGSNMALTGTGEPDIDGYQFDGLGADVVDIGPVSNKAGGTDTLSVKLSGLPGLDADMLAEINDRTHWQGREVRLWRIIRNAANIQQGGVQHYYTGNMAELSISATPEGQAINMAVESYIAAYAPAANRTYLDQAKYDAGDQSARAAIAIGNNGSGGSIGGGVFTPSGGGRGPIGGNVNFL